MGCGGEVPLEEPLQSCILPAGPAPVKGQHEVWGEGHNSPHAMWSISHGLEGVVREQSGEQDMDARRDTNVDLSILQGWESWKRRRCIAEVRLGVRETVGQGMLQSCQR